MKRGQVDSDEGTPGGTEDTLKQVIDAARRPSPTASSLRVNSSYEQSRREPRRATHKIASQQAKENETRATTRGAWR
jgi:hypothetical protein